MLNVIYPSHAKITGILILIGLFELIISFTEVNFEYLLELGDRFEIKVGFHIKYFFFKLIIFEMVIDQAEQFLIDSTELNNSTKFLLSDQYRLIKLQV